MAETVGFDSVWFGESLLARPRFEPLTTLAAIAASTHRMKLGTAVLLPALRHPLPLAQSVATLDRITTGRLILGLGAGFNYPPTAHELESVGVPFKQRVGRMIETITILRKLWGTEEPVDYDGRFWRFSKVELLPRPWRSGGPRFGSAVTATTRCFASGRLRC